MADEAKEAFFAFAKAAKEGMGTSDLVPFFNIWRGDEQVATGVGRFDMGDVLDVTWLAFVAMDATRLDFSTESFIALTELNPETNDHWEEGDMQYLYETNPELAEGAVSTSITCISIHLDGSAETRQLAYHIEGEQVAWDVDEGWMDLNDVNFQDSLQKLVDSLVEGPLERLDRENDGKLRGGMSETEWDFYKDMTGLKVIYDKMKHVDPFTMTLASIPGSEREKVIKESGVFDQVQGDTNG